MSKTESIIAATVSTETSARCTPGQTLARNYTQARVKSDLKHAYLRPNPKATLRGSISGCLPFGPGRNLSGLKVKGSKYISGSWSIFLQYCEPREHARRRESAYHWLTQTMLPFGMKYPS